jgi:hypothetical protein
MWSMWTAPSDLDYYASFGGEPDDEEFERCSECGARWDAGQECEPWCANQPASEPAPTAFFEIQPIEVRPSRESQCHNEEISCCNSMENCQIWR